MQYPEGENGNFTISFLRYRYPFPNLSAVNGLFFNALHLFQHGGGIKDRLTDCRCSRTRNNAGKKPQQTQNRLISILVPTTKSRRAKTRFRRPTGRLWANRTPKGAVRTLVTTRPARAGR